ncbi:MAG: hypothetical protein HYV63_13925 [Candidatus Schekmanbacteria bacterium]|nr:hypothetical protein [Candidatus Schekmanbacteria bacterium]
METKVREAVGEIAVGTKEQLGEAWLRKVGNLHVLKVKGSFYEMGRQHGVLLRDAIARGPLLYYRTYLEKMLAGAGAGVLAPQLRRLLDLIVGRKIRAAIPAFAEETIRGLADGAGYPFADVLEGCVMPESLLWLVARNIRLARTAPAVRHRVQLGLGCSSAIAWGGATATGKLLHARNFDYHGVSTWPREAAVIFHEPTQGQRYVSISSAGVPLGGVQAMNESGLTLAVHQHMLCDTVRLGGCPVGVMGDRVMREATNLQEAETILRSYRAIGGFTYLVCDGRARRVLCMEENPDRKVFTTTPVDDTTFAYANIFRDPALGRTERDLYPSYWRHNSGRQARLAELLDRGHGGLDPAGMAAILADTGPDICRLSRAIAMLMTVASVVFDPEDSVIWVGTGETPAAHSDFLPFSLKTEDFAPEFGTLPGGSALSAASRSAFAAYRQAYVAYVDSGDRRQALQRMGEACELQPEQALYQFLCGLLAMKHGDLGLAEASLERAVAIGHSDSERRATFHLWRGRVRDLAARRLDAIDDYRAVLAADRCDPAAGTAARKGLVTPYRARKAAKVALDFAFADVIAP